MANSLISTRKLRKGCKITIGGDMTIYTVAQLKQEVSPVLAAHAALEVDLSRVAEIDTAGLQLLCAMKREAARLQKSFSLKNHSAAVVEILELLRACNYFGDPVVLKA